MKRVPVRMRIRVEPDGAKKPLSFVWTDGLRYSVDGTSRGVRLSEGKSVGKSGTRYAVILGGMPAYVYEEDGIWSVEPR